MALDGILTALGGRIRRHADLLLLLAGAALAMIALPSEAFWPGFLLFALGMSAGQWEEKINPKRNREGEEALPTPPWSEMDAAEKRAYVLPPLIYGALSVPLLAALFLVDFREIGWVFLIGGCALAACAIYSGRQRWKGRFGTWAPLSPG
ncbi:hypothetical protein [Sphingomonas colocasiae]|uniref:Uncharacterized protein n=1 Tax=Sphingomonas colocasiae TaxID=1848973 RepID=A0ABS7PV09_9SPHN|nr:hypothetical protein [Sphingomonas colocasiae]MBY8825033.1 hypothetical protein [Sphingomonas colocasiae]